MPDTTNTLRIRSHVRQIAALSKDAGGDAWFSLNLAPVLVTDPRAANNVTPAMAAQYLTPWNWQWSDVRVALFQGGAFQSFIAADVAVVTDTPIPALTAAFTAEFNSTAGISPAAPFQSGCFVENLTSPSSVATMDADSPRDWKTYLLHASSYAGDIPLRAGLVAWFHIPYAQLAGADEIVVAPVFTGGPFAAACAPQTAAAGLTALNSNLKPYAPGDGQLLRHWSYNPPAAGDLAAEWIQPSLKLRIPNTPSWVWDSDDFIAEETLWVKPPAPRTTVAQATDTHEQLEQRLSGLFDLPSRLLEWADQWLVSPIQPTPGQPAPPPPHTSIDANFGAALIASMRDLLRTADEPASLQFLERPDSGTLAADIARVLAPKDPAVRTQILTAVRTYYAQFDNYAHWIVRVTATLAANLDANAFSTNWETPPAAGGDFNTWLKLMHRARAWLFDPANLKAFIMEDWGSALGQNASLNALWQDKTLSGNVESFLANTDLVTVQRLAFLGRVWANQTADWYSPDNLSQKMQDALVNVYRERLGLQPQSGWGYQNLQPHATGVQTEQADIEKYLTDFVTKWSTSAGGPKPAANTPADYSRGNQGINIQFANYAKIGGTTVLASGITEDEYLATFRGVGVMMRVSGANPWSLLHLGQYSVRGEVDPTLQQTPAYDGNRVVVAPAGIVYRNGLRQVSSTYRNQPLAARSPAAALSRVRKFKTDAATTPGLFEFWNPYGRTGSLFKLPRLVFGQSYDVAAFAVGLAGELPREISDGAKPWRVNADPAQWNPPAGAAVTIGPYKRTLPIGPIRVEGAQSWTVGQGISKMTGPSMPDGVYPIIRSMNSIAYQTDPVTGSMKHAAGQEDPVFLLCDPASKAWTSGVAAKNASATIHIRPPATDLATFDGWPLVPALSVQDRAELYSFTAQNTDVQNVNDPNAGPDLTLDDPAVTGFSAMLTQIYPPPPAGAPAPQPTPIGLGGPSPNAVIPQLAPRQSTSVGIQFKAVPANGAASINPPAAPGTNWTINVPAGTVYRIDLTPVTVDLTNLSTRPDVAARSFYVEVAAPLSFDSKTIAATLSAALSPAPAWPQTKAADPLTVSLNLTQLGPLAPQIHRVELMIERWRWQGRPLARTIGQDNNGNDIFSFDFPYGDLAGAQAPATVDSILEPLDGIYFGERQPSDMLIVSAQVDSLLPGPAANLAPLLYSYDLSHAPQALYYRFAVRVFSRYEGMLATGASVESRFSPASPAEQWRRVLPLCRRTQKAPKPAVRLIIPLTQTGPAEQTPGLMVVLDEPWFDWGGLAEQLKVQIQTVITPETVNGPDKDKVYLTQAGPDPIVNNPKFGQPPPEIGPALTAAGPVGFTADTSTNAPLFAKTSFIVPAPAQTPGPAPTTDLSWWFLQLSFQRALNTAGTMSPNGLDSDWTNPIQVQLLPAANLWYVTWKNGGTPAPPPRPDVNDLDARSSGAGIALFDQAGNELIVNPQPIGAPAGTPVRNRFEVWVLLTFSLTDAFGNPGQEAFVDLIPFANLQGYQALPGSNAPGVIRLVEVQCMNDYSPPRTSWSKLPDGTPGLADDLFPPPVADKLNPPGTPPGAIDPAMARARIVRVSPPVRISQ